MKRKLTVLALAAFVVIIAGCSLKHLRLEDRSDHKVYVILGFHANFYHSWRGDTPDEGGFGTDIRVVREIIRMLDEANAKGLDARGYWEGESLFTFEDIIPNYAPDIIDGIRRRIDAGQDEFMPAPYSNTLFSAVTEDEMRKAVEWSISNPWGSGAKDLFGSYVPLLRPQEAMTTTGQIPILLDEGIEGLVLAYSTYSFTAFSNFVPPMPPEQRYGLTWMKMRDDGPRMILFPCVSAADVVNFTSLEKWMLKLRKLQTSGKVDQDLVIHMNFDADAETWLPMLPDALGGIPNGGGLPEYIKYVNKYDWAEFALPSEFMATHKPQGEVIIRQDTADGGWDGNYSWAEKYPSHVIWTDLEKSRLYTRQAKALLEGAPAALKAQTDKLLFEGRESSFFLRLRGLSTTHFGMSTPMVNEERQAVAESTVEQAKAQAGRARREAIDWIADKTETSKPQDLYTFLIKDSREKGQAIVAPVRIPVILADDDIPLRLFDDKDNKVPFSLIDVKALPKKRRAATVLALTELAPGKSVKLHLRQFPALMSPPPPEPFEPVNLETLDNGILSLELDKSAGVKSFKFKGNEVGGSDFLAPFITYKSGKKPVVHATDGYEFANLRAENWQGVKRSALKTSIPFETRHGSVKAEIEIAFTLPDNAPWAIADVTVRYPYTVKEDMLNNVQQRLRRYLDLAWVEVAPFQLHPRFDATREEPLKVWKHNYLDVTSWYEVNYGQINPKNAQLDSFNHQVTAGWVAVTDRSKGLLVAEDSEIMSSYAFMPMRLRESTGHKQQLYLNPFGSYHGKQMDYSHLGGNGLGSEIADMASSALRPNGPSYNGMTESFSLLLAPYTGDEPPADLQALGEAFFYPAAVVYLHTPDGIEAGTKEDVQALVESALMEEELKSKSPLPEPLAFLANPTDGEVHLVWDEPNDARIAGYEIRWRQSGSSDWTVESTDRTNRYQVKGLANGTDYEFSVRSLGVDSASDWVAPQEVKVGPAQTAGVLSAASGASPTMIFKFLYYTFDHLLTTP